MTTHRRAARHGSENRQDQVGIQEQGPLWGGVLSTAGDLVFTGTPEGFLKAFDAKTGKELWKFQTGSGVVGSPVTWEMDGEQYVSVSVWLGRRGAAVGW